MTSVGGKGENYKVGGIVRNIPQTLLPAFHWRRKQLANKPGLPGNWSLKQCVCIVWKMPVINYPRLGLLSQKACVRVMLTLFCCWWNSGLSRDDDLDLNLNELNLECLDEPAERLGIGGNLPVASANFSPSGVLIFQTFLLCCSCSTYLDN